MIILTKGMNWFRQQKKLRELRARRRELEDFIKFVEKMNDLRAEFRKRSMSI